MRSSLLTSALSLAVLATASAEEGMFTFDNFPARAVKEVYNVDVPPQWLDRVRLATVRLANCTASFVSKDGLILTNHHCAAQCLSDNSTKERSYLEAGFLPKDASELACKTQVADVLVTMEEVTAKVAAATHGLDEKAANEARKKTLTDLESSCEAAAGKDPKTGPLRCEAVTLYEGGQYFLYKYKRYTDVRLAFAPEAAIAAFGGDPDNFQFPRWCLDMALLRVYENGKPASTPNHLSIDFAGAKAGDAVFVSGHPGTTNRLYTEAQLETLRNTTVPGSLLRGFELRGRLIQFAKVSPENARIAESPLNGLENGMKVRRKQLDALHEESLFALKRRREEELKVRVAADPKLKEATGDPWREIAAAQARFQEFYLPYTFIEVNAGFGAPGGQLFRYARDLVRGAVEREKPSNERLREYTDPRLPRLEQRLLAPIPVYPELERLTLSFGLERMREYLGPDHTLVRSLLAKDSPDSLAESLVAGTRLGDHAVRAELWKGGRKAIEASTDPMVRLALSVEPEARALRKRMEDEVEATEQKATERIARARFAVYGTSTYPDATFTLRLNYGSVQGWNELGATIEPFTRLGRLYERATGKDPFRLPEAWIKAKASLDMNTPFNFSTNNDIVGGNSGSPVVDAKGAIVGLAFDGNIHSISGSYWFDKEKNRMVAVHPAVMKEALTKVYGATALYRELGGR